MFQVKCGGLFPVDGAGVCVLWKSLGMLGVFSLLCVNGGLGGLCVCLIEWCCVCMILVGRFGVWFVFLVCVLYGLCF